jgi:hypothetical protein
MQFLRLSDYLYKITENDLVTLVEDEVSPDLFILDCEMKAQEQVSLFLRKRYDLQKLFETYPDYRPGDSYTTGNTVWYSMDDDSTYTSYLFKPKSGSTTSLPSSNNWERFDPRNKNIVDWMVTISIFKLHERISPDSIPKHRKDAYDEVIAFLKGIQSGKLSPDFPEVENRIQNIYVGGVETNGIGFNY